MKVKALVSFIAPDLVVVAEGDIVEMPDGADWVKVGHCKPVEEKPKAKAKK
jgi:hypothetical protein